MEALDREDLADGFKKAGQSGWFLVSYRAALLVGVLFANGYFWLYADAHNDARYVKREDYMRDQVEGKDAHEKERASDATVEALREEATATRLGGVEKWLSEISGDVKELLKENRSK